jgi:2-dehydro-3-deoxyphosphooctonate aldolase (KDO 8-P synthase)
MMEEMSKDPPIRTIQVGAHRIGPHEPLALLLGPCVIESESHTLFCAERLQKIVAPFPFSLIFKASYDKANRSSIRSFRGPGLDEGLAILEKVKRECGLPVLSDVHSVEEARAAGSLLDMIQIPAFLCRQTDLLVAAASTPAAINVKKGQFLAPWDMAQVADKLSASGASQILLTDRGASFGYNNLVSDFRSIPIFHSLGYPACYDASHSVQLPGNGETSGGERRFIPTLARAAIAAGANALFLETHPDPSRAKSDAATVFPFDALPLLLSQLAKIYDAVQSHAPVA